MLTQLIYAGTPAGHACNAVRVDGFTIEKGASIGHAAEPCAGR
jgi:hypothetical protein